MPPMCPTRTGLLAFETQAPGACDEVCVAASADPPATARVAAPAATRVKVARMPRLLNAVFIRVPSFVLAVIPRRTPRLSSHGQNVRLHKRFRGRPAASSALCRWQPKSSQLTISGDRLPSGAFRGEAGLVLDGRPGSAKPS